jgi:glycosyltransferase involved in cell wall biosynthesis
MRKAVRQVLTVGLLLRLGWKGTPIVRTVHNLNLPEGITLRERLLLQTIDRRTMFRITLNTETPMEAGSPHALIPHGDYREWFSPYLPEEPLPGHIAYVGLIRRYKGVEGLLAAFRATEPLMDGLVLHLAGNPTSTELRDTILRLAAPDPRIRLQLEFIPDGQLVKLMTASELVVLPYRFMHNSGAILTALSLGRPVLVPDNAVNRRLAEEVGPGWIFTFEGEIRAEHIVRTLYSLKAAAPSRNPVFLSRDWTHGSEAHVQAYREAIALARTARR